MSSTYLPVTKYEKYKSHRYWLNDNPYFTYNKILVSPFTTGLNRLRMDFKNATIYADSGGYQIATKRLRISAMHILHLQENIADVGFTVDVPPHAFEDYTNAQFMECMQKSNDNAELMLRFKENDDMQLWGVIQGSTFVELETWYYDLIKNYEFVGYCISLSNPKSDMIMPWFRPLEFAKTIKKPMHFLGSSNRLFALALARFSRIMKINYTYDTSSSTVGVRWAKYMIPETYAQISFSSTERPIDKLPCDCPICTRYSVIDLRYNLPLVMLHNLYVQTNFCRFANIVAEDDELFKFVLQKIVMQSRYQNYIDNIVDLLGYDFVTSSYDKEEAIEKFNMKVIRTKELTDVDKVYLQQFIVKFIELKV